MVNNVQLQLQHELSAQRWRALDKALVRFFAKELPHLSDWWLLVIGETSLALAQGHLCLEVSEMQHYLASVDLEWPDLATELANATELVAKDELDQRPLVYANQAFYFQRYYLAQQSIQQYLQRTVAQSQGLRSQLPVAPLAKVLALLFPVSTEPDWQRLACAISASSMFSVITGGPGTGKTTTVVKLLALLQLLQQQQELPWLKLVLAAPTGKAAVRLRSSIGKALTALAVPEQVKAVLPAEVFTVHKLLGARPHSQQFRHHQHNPLLLDVLVVDEASMLDVDMMLALLNALPTHARLVLLGDKDQLASVEAGALLASLCQHAGAGGYHPDTLHWLQQFSQASLPTDLLSSQATALDQHIAMLRRSYRFSSDSGIAGLALAVNQGDVAAVRQLCQQQTPDVQVLLRPSSNDLRQLLLCGQTTAGGTSGFGPYLQLAQHEVANEVDVWAWQVLQAFGRFQLLCAVRQGDYGVDALNQLTEQQLHQQGWIDASQQWYVGRPVLICENDYQLGLMNGDVGICLRRTVQGRSLLVVAFAASDKLQGIQWVLPSRLPAHETAYAITVHKSQGSEFAHAVLVMPDKASAVLTRELVYTAITRAAERFSLVCPDPDLLDQAVSRRTSRAGAIRIDHLLASQHQLL